MLQNVPVATFGSYIIEVSGLNDSAGDYELEVVLNAAIEAEYHGGLDNSEITAPAPAFAINTSKISHDSGGGPPLHSQEFFGGAIASVGDLDGDGVTDIAVGAAWSDGFRGAIYILNLNADGTAKSSQRITYQLGGGPELSANDFFGLSVTSLGDLNGDGITDLAVGAPGDDEGGNGRGAIYILFMNIDGTVNSFQKIARNTGGGPTLADADSFGWSIGSLGDLDGDGVADVAVGAVQDDSGASSGTSNLGALHVLLLNTDGTAKSSHKIATLIVTDDDTVVSLPESTASDGIRVVPTGDGGEYEVVFGPHLPPSLGMKWYAQFAGKTSYQTAGRDQWAYGDDFISIDSGKTYALNGYARSGDEFGQRFDADNLQSFGFAAYDVNLQPLPAQHINFAALDSEAIGGDWTWKQSSALFGIGTGLQFPADTAFIKPVVLANQHGLTNNFVEWRGVSVTEVPTGTTVADLAQPIVDLTTVTDEDQRTRLTLLGAGDYLTTEQLIAVDPAERYTLSAWGYNIVRYLERPLGFASLDIDKKTIPPVHVQRYDLAVDTTLAAALNPRDTSFLVTNASGWSVHISGSLWYRLYLVRCRFRWSRRDSLCLRAVVCRHGHSVVHTTEHCQWCRGDRERSD